MFSKLQKKFFPKIAPPTATTEVFTISSMSWMTIGAYAALYVGWGTTYLAIRVGVQSFSPASYLGLRFMIAAILLFPYILMSRSLKTASLRQILHSAIVGVLLLVCSLLITAYSEQTLPSNIVAIIIGCVPVSFAIFDWLLNGATIRKTVVIGFCFGITGVVLLALGHRQDNPTAGINTIGLVQVLIGSTAWAFGSVLSKRLKPISTAIPNIFVQYVAAAIVLMVIAYGFEGFQLIQLNSISKDAWISLIYIALLPSIISYSAYMWLLKHEPSARVATYAFVNPIVAVIAGALILNESTSPVILTALLLVSIGTLLNFKKEMPRKNKEHEYAKWNVEFNNLKQQQ